MGCASARRIPLQVIPLPFSSGGTVYTLEASERTVRAVQVQAGLAGNPSSKCAWVIDAECARILLEEAAEGGLLYSCKSVGLRSEVLTNVLTSIPFMPGRDLFPGCGGYELGLMPQLSRDLRYVTLHAELVYRYPNVYSERYNPSEVNPRIRILGREEAILPIGGSKWILFEKNLGNGRCDVLLVTVETVE